MQFLFFLITTMFQMGISKKITFNKHFARKYIRAYTNNIFGPKGPNILKLHNQAKIIKISVFLFWLPNMVI